MGGGLSLTLANSDPHSGIPTWLSNNLEEFENVAVSWDNSSAVPAWLKGTYFKNGPARQDFGGKLSYGNMADGWAKITKFNVDSTEDKIWYKEEHYSGEPIFIPNPNGSSEDDGVLLVIVLDGSTQLSYLLLLDGQSFETLAEARLDTFIPMSIHGSWFDEIF